ncbi:LysR family transcriptional regulator, partial [Puniceibacterium confluentis]
MTDPDREKLQVFLPSLTQLRAFYEVARLTSISGAADYLRRSQSAVTQSVQKLESELGVTLFDRTSAGSYLTDMGRILESRIDRCFDRIRSAVEALLIENGDDPAPADAMARRITRAQILALTAVHEHGSFALAARHVQVSLTSLHRSARTLEKQLGRELLVNSAQGVTTNSVGGKLSNQLLLAIRELEWAAEEIRSQQGIYRGRIAVGTLLLAGNPFVAVRLDDFVTRHPGVLVQLIHGSYDELLAKLRGGSIDFLVGLLKNPPPTDDVAEEGLAKDPYVICVRNGHPLVARGSVRVEDLRAAEWISPRPSSLRRGTYEEIFSGGPLPESGVETHSLLTLLVLLERSDRMALMTRSELALNRRLGGQLTELGFAVDAVPPEIGITTRANWKPP